VSGPATEITLEARPSKSIDFRRSPADLTWVVAGAAAEERRCVVLDARPPWLSLSGHFSPRPGTLKCCTIADSDGKRASRTVSTAYLERAKFVECETVTCESNLPRPPNHG
jgi:hypothetical protein